MSAIKKYNNLQGKKLYRRQVRALINEAKKQGESEIQDKLCTLLRQYPNQRGFEFTQVTPVVIKQVTPVIIKDDFEALGIPYLSPELEKELGTTEIEGLGKRVSNDDIYKMITDKFVKIIDEHDRMPWSSGFNDAKEKESDFSFNNLPVNYASKKYYRGINALVLSMYRFHTEETKGKVYINSKGFEQGEVEMIEDDRLFWLTFKQIKEAKGKLKKDSLSQQAIYYNWIFSFHGKKISEQKYKQLKKQFGCYNTSTSDNCKALQKYGFLKYYNVFNERDIEGVDFKARRAKLKTKAKTVKTIEQKILAAELMLKHMPLKPKLQIKFIDKDKNESPYYSPSLDKVVMPQKTQFDNLSQWYGVAFHEHIHATGHAKRTDRRSIRGFTRGTRWGDTQYAMEELVAEIGSAFLNAESGILLDNLKNNAAYIKGWQKGVKKHLQKDNKAIFIAAGQSQKAADYILDFDKDGDPKYWKEYEKIQKEIKVKGKKQSESKKSKVVSKKGVSSRGESKKEKLKIINHPFKYFDIAINHTYKLFTIRFKDHEPPQIRRYLKSDNYKETANLHWQRKIGAWGDPKDRLDILSSNMLGIYKKLQKDAVKKKDVEKKEKDKKAFDKSLKIDESQLKKAVKELSYDKSMTFKEAIQFVLKDSFNIDRYRAYIKMFLNRNIVKKLTKKQAIEIEDFGTFKVEPLFQNMVKPKKMSFRDAVVMMNKEVASRDDLRPVMMHVLHEKNYLVSTDAHALAVIKVNENENGNDIVYDKTGRKHKNIGIYPKYKNVIPQDNSFVTKFDLKELITKIKGIVKAQACVTENGLHGVIVFDKKNIYFNPAIMLRGLTPLYKNGVTDVNLYVGAPNRAILLKDVNDEKQLALCMPVMGGFEHKIVAEIYGNYTNGKDGLKGVLQKYTQPGLFGIHRDRKKKRVGHNVSHRIKSVIHNSQNVLQPIALPIEKPVYKSKNHLVKGINHVSHPNENFAIGGAIGNFLGDIEIKPVGSVACTIDAPQGTGKTRFFFQIMNELAKKYKVLFISLEEHPASTLFKAKVAQYINPENQNNIDTIGELARGQEKQILDDLIPQYDVVLVDSWNKIFEAAKLDFDNDLRKAYNGKLIFAIFQRTVTGTMRGGAKSQFDGDIIMKIDKGDDFKQNEVYHDKNRYQNKDLSQLRYNIYSQSLSGGLLSNESVPKLQIQKTQPVIVWEDAIIELEFN